VESRAPKPQGGPGVRGMGVWGGCPGGVWVMGHGVQGPRGPGPGSPRAEGGPEPPREFPGRFFLGAQISEANFPESDANSGTSFSGARS